MPAIPTREAEPLALLQLHCRFLKTLPVCIPPIPSQACRRYKAFGDFDVATKPCNILADPERQRSGSAFFMDYPIGFVG